MLLKTVTSIPGSSLSALFPSNSFQFLNPKYSTGLSLSDPCLYHQTGVTLPSLSSWTVKPFPLQRLFHKLFSPSLYLSITPVPLPDISSNVTSSTSLEEGHSLTPLTISGHLVKLLHRTLHFSFIMS